mmetsp:Transcript_97/g.159  ORF Transcript_97/g.159 Transcript_97/m.159 type:complete len:90 (-) Transcript_97:79-348(-)
MNSAMKNFESDRGADPPSFIDVPDSAPTPVRLKFEGIHSFGKSPPASTPVTFFGGFPAPPVAPLVAPPVAAAGWAHRLPLPPVDPKEGL